MIINFLKKYSNLILVSVVYGLSIGVYILIVLVFFKDQILKLPNDTAGNIGSFLGGVFAPLAFITLFIQFSISQDERLKNVEKEKKEKNSIEKKSQPFFKISDFSYKYENESSFDGFGNDVSPAPCSDLNFNLVNLGANTHSVNIEIVGSDYSKEILETLNFSERKIIYIKAIPSMSINPNYIKIVFRYMDANQEAKSKKQKILYFMGYRN